MRNKYKTTLAFVLLLCHSSYAWPPHPAEQGGSRPLEEINRVLKTGSAEEKAKATEELFGINSEASSRLLLARLTTNLAKKQGNHVEYGAESMGDGVSWTYSPSENERIVRVLAGRRYAKVLSTLHKMLGVNEKWLGVSHEFVASKIYEISSRPVSYEFEGEKRIYPAPEPVMCGSLSALGLRDSSDAAWKEGNLNWRLRELDRNLQGSGGPVGYREPFYKALKEEFGLAKLIGLVQNGDPSIRPYAVQGLALLGDWKAAIPVLVEATADKDPSVRFKSVEAFVYMDFSTAEPEAVAPIIPALLKALSDPQREVRYIATKAIARNLFLARRSGSATEMEKAAAGLLILTLEDKYIDVRVEAASALAVIGPVNPQVVPLLGRMLKSADPCERGGGVDALGGIAADPHGPFDQEESARLRKQIMQMLFVMKNDSAENVRQSVVSAMDEIASSLDGVSDQKERKGLMRKITQTLLSMISDPAREVRYSVAETLEKIGPEFEGVIPALIKLTRDGARGVRSQAASSLGTFEIGRDRIIPALISMLKVKNEDSEVIESALRSLESMGNEARSAAPVVRKLLKSENPRTREYAGYALEKIDPVPRAKTARKKSNL